MNSQTLEHTTDSRSLKNILPSIALALGVIVTSTQDSAADTLNISVKPAAESFNSYKHVDLNEYLGFNFTRHVNYQRAVRDTYEHADLHQGKKIEGTFCNKVESIKTIYYSGKYEPAEELRDKLYEKCGEKKPYKFDSNRFIENAGQAALGKFGVKKVNSISSKRHKSGINSKSCTEGKTKVNYVTSTLERRGIKMKPKLRNLSHRKCNKSFMHIVQKAKECSNVLGVKQKDYVKYSQSCGYFSTTPMVFEHMVGYHTSAAMCGSDVKRADSPIQGLNPGILVARGWEQKKDNRVTKMCSHLSGNKGLNCLITKGKESYNKILITEEMNDMQFALDETFGSPATCNVYKQ